MVVHGFLHKLVDFLGDLLLRVEQHLLLIVLPVEREVKNSDSFPVVAHLGAGSVDHAGHFVCHNKLEVLQMLVH